MCHRAFREKALTAYHAWFNGENRTCYKQRMCLACFNKQHAASIKRSIDLDNVDAVEPDTCPFCGEGVIGDDSKTWSTWYRGNNRRDVLIVACDSCATDLRALMMAGAERQPDRPVAGVGAGGAPLPNPPGFGASDDLPW